MEILEKLQERILEQNPTDEQREAIFTDSREFLLRASPGSGKTWTSCRRFIWRAANWDKDAGGLALLSFTNTAVREFHEATIGVGHREFLSDPNYLGTFDAFVERFIITPFGHLVTGRKERPRLFLGPRPGDHNNDKLKGWMNVGAKNRPVPAWDIIPYLTEDRKVGYKSSSQHGGREINLKWGSNPVNELFKLVSCELNWLKNGTIPA